MVNTRITYIEKKIEWKKTEKKWIEIKIFNDFFPSKTRYERIFVTTHFGFKSKDSFVNQDFSHEIQMKYAFLLVIVSLPMKMECEDFTNILRILLTYLFQTKDPNSIWLRCRSLNINILSRVQTPKMQAISFDPELGPLPFNPREFFCAHQNCFHFC